MIESIVDGPRAGVGVEVMARCLDHPKVVFKTRLRRLKQGETKTCGCLKKANFKNHLAEQVTKLAPDKVEGCWVSRYRGTSRKTTAKKYELAAAVVDEAVRSYQAKLDSLIADGTAFEIHRKVSTAEKGKYKSSDAATKLKLPIEVVRYLISVAANRINGGAVEYMEQRDHIDDIACKAEYALDCVAERNILREHWRNELTTEELRRTRRGELLGKRALLYSDCKRLNRNLLDAKQAEIVDRFLEIADDTLQKRIDRRNAAIRQKGLLKQTEKMSIQELETIPIE